MRTLFLFLLGGLAVVQTACSKETLPAQGELLVLLSSDMQVPDSFNALVVTVSGSRHVYLPDADQKRAWLDLAENADTLDSDCVPHTDDIVAENLVLPTTLGLQSTNKTDTAGTLGVTVCRSGSKVFSKSLEVTLPGEGNVTALRVPIRWLCTDKGSGDALGCYGCDSTRCYGKSVHLDNAAASPCSVEACQNQDTAYPSIEYDPVEVARYHTDASNTTECFDVLQCFSTEHLVVPSGESSYPIATDWRERPNGDVANPSSDCIARLDSSTLDPARLNLALLLPPGTFGTCTDAHCLVALEANSPLGYRVDPDHDHDLLLPSAVCNMLDSGQLLAVLASDQCPPRRMNTPICGAKTQSSNVDDGTTSYADTLNSSLVAHYRFDETDEPATLFSDEIQAYDLAFVTPTESDDDAPRIDGVRGYARTFDSRHYAKSQVRFPAQNSYTLVGWLALPEVTFAETSDASHAFVYGPHVAVLSNLGAQCNAGFRLELERCTDGQHLQVAFAVPNGKGENGQCVLEWHYATFAERSWAGGYFSPAKRGDFRSLAVVYEKGSSPAVYVDGIASTPTNTSCTANASNTGVNDDSYLFVGSNAELVESSEPITAPIEVDEVAIYAQALTETELRWLSTNTSTVIGPGNLHWGAWATQGSSAEVQEASPKGIGATINDKSFSSAGLNALLGPDAAPGVPAFDKKTDLSIYDEAVIWVDLPEKTPFQFALTAEHGKRQCTWQLVAGAAPYYVINLQQPSWCVDPKCGFSLSEVEQVSVGSDWTRAVGTSASFSVSALAFRKRLFTTEDTSPGAPTRVDGQLGPGNWCWRAISYDPQWLARLTRFTPELGIGLEMVRNTSSSTLPELVADLPTLNSAAQARDFSHCPHIKVVTPKALPEGKFEFALTNELGQTFSWPLSPLDGNGSYVATLDDKGQGWPTGENEATKDFPVPANAATVRDHAVRMALRFASAIQVRSIQCCDSNMENCVDVDETNPPDTKR